METWKTRDPIPRFVAALRERSWLDEAAEGAIEASVAAEIAAAVAEAEAGPWEPVSDLLRDVHTPASPR